MTNPAKNTICLWYDGDAEEAAGFYATTFPDSSVDAVHRAPADYPSGKKGAVLTVEFHSDGNPLHRTQRWPRHSAQHGVFISSRNRRPGRNRSLLDGHRESRRRRKPVWMVQRQMGRLLADHTRRFDKRLYRSRSNSRPTSLRCNDDDAEDRRRRHRSSDSRLKSNHSNFRESHGDKTIRKLPRRRPEEVDGLL